MSNNPYKEWSLEKLKEHIQLMETAIARKVIDGESRYSRYSRYDDWDTPGSR